MSATAGPHASIHTPASGGSPAPSRLIRTGPSSPIPTDIRPDWAVIPPKGAPEMTMMEHPNATVTDSWRPSEIELQGASTDGHGQIRP